MIHIPEKILSDYMIQIERGTNIPMKKKVVEAFRSGKIELYLTDDKFLFPDSIPILLKRNDMTAMINITNYSKVTRDIEGSILSIDIQQKKLLTLLTSAWFYREWSIDESKFARNSVAVRQSAMIYSKIIYKVLDREYSIGASMNSMTIVYSLFAYFFASYLAGYKHAAATATNLDMVNDKARSADYIRELSKTYPSFNSFPDVISALNTSVASVKNLDALSFLSKFSIMWKNLIGAVDFLPYFMTLVFSAYIGGDVTKDVFFNSVSKKAIDDLMAVLPAVY
jgi:hypothetical protein